MPEMSWFSSNTPARARTWSARRLPRRWNANSVMLLRPALLIADEPTTALDCLAQLDVIELMLELTREQGTAILFISHDLSLVARYAHKVVVMRAGKAVEQGRIEDILFAPKAEYTRQLLEALGGGPSGAAAALAPVVVAAGARAGRRAPG